jgi:hypothetical protein
VLEILARATRVLYRDVASDLSKQQHPSVSVLPETI